MIVRCNSCVSAFAVDDEKVAGKKFAFTCPKCGSENIIDNKTSGHGLEEGKPDAGGDFAGDDFSMDSDFNVKEDKTSAGTDFDSMLPDDFEADGKSEPVSAEDDLFMDLEEEGPSTEAAAEKRSLNLEIEESSDIPDFADDDILSDLPEISSDDEPLSFDEKKGEQSSDEFDIELKGESSAVESDDIIFDDFGDSAGDTSIEIEDDMLAEKPGAEEDLSDRERKLTSQDDIDALFAEEGIEFDEKPISKESEKQFEDDITLDLDSLDIEIDEKGGMGDVLEFTETAKEVKPEEDDIAVDLDALDIELDEEIAGTSVRAADSPAAEEDITIDLESLDIDLEEKVPAESGGMTKEVKPEEDDIAVDLDALDIDIEDEGIAEISEPAKGKNEDDITLDLDDLDIDLDEKALLEVADGTAAVSDSALPDEEDITVDLDALDIDLEDEGMAEFSEPAKGKNEDDITLDLDDLDIDLDEKAPLEAADMTSAASDSALPDEDDITVDLDALDIDLEDEGMAEFSEPAEGKNEDDITLDLDDLDIDLAETPASSGEKIKHDHSALSSGPSDDEEFDEDDIKLNLDDLDIDLDEIEERELVFEDDIPVEKPVSVREKIKEAYEEDEEDESITIDLDTLELELAEENGFIDAEMAEEDEKLTLDDAGLTFDELAPRSKKPVFELPEEDEIKLTIDEVDPDLALEQITESAETGSGRLVDDMEELPEIDLDEYDAIIREEKRHGRDEYEEELDIFPDSGGTASSRYGDAYDVLESGEQEISTGNSGSVFFSIDFSLKYSRLGALMRLLGLYLISMIPHFVVMFVYSMLSSILGFINQIVVLSTGRCVEDFAMVIENTLRYFFYIKTNVIGIIEDRPVYAGREHLDHPLQLGVTYPLKYSKTLAILRLSIAGIMIVTLPHLIILLLLTVTIPVVYLMGIISVIATRRWPNILFIYLTRYFRYVARISSFLSGLTDEYPSFRFD